MDARRNGNVVDVGAARDLARDLVEALRERASCDGAQLFWLDATGGMLVEIAATGTPAGRRRAVVHPGQGAVGNALVRAKRVVEREDMLATVAAPVRVDGLTVGVLAARFAPESPTRRQEALVSHVAASTASPALAILQFVAEERLASEKYDSIATLVRSCATNVRLEDASNQIESTLTRLLGTDYAAIARRKAERSGIPPTVVLRGDLTQDGRERIAGILGMPELRRDGDTVLVVPVITAAGHVADLVAGWHFSLELQARAVSFAETLAGHAATAYATAQRDDRVAAMRPSANRSHTEGGFALEALRSAIALNHFEVVYQPIFDLRTGRMVQCEALCRWPTAPRAFSSPDHFIRLAEDHGLIDSLTERVVITALREWQSMPADVRLAINVSTLTLLDPRFCTTLLKLLRILGCPPERLSIELTETALLPGDRRQEAIGTAAELSRSGILISIDDFGEGHASFAYLKMFEAGSIKIDRGFITQIIGNSLDVAIVKSIIDLAHDLKIVVTAEGVENAATVDVMRSLGCDLVQGFGCARPMTADLLRRYVERGALLGAYVDVEQAPIASRKIS